MTKFMCGGRYPFITDGTDTRIEGDSKDYAVASLYDYSGNSTYDMFFVLDCEPDSKWRVIYSSFGEPEDCSDKIADAIEDYERDGTYEKDLW